MRTPPPVTDQAPLTRRRFALLAAATPLLGLARPGVAATVMGDDGMHTQDWFLQTFLHLPEDTAEAHAAGKLLAVVWEQKGCPYCRDLHEVNFADPDIAAFARAKFNWIQMNLFGEREVTDLDGTAMPEKQLARKARATFTPTIQFLAMDPQPREVTRMPGYLKPAEFMLMLRYAAEGHWRGADFPTWAKTRQGA